MKKGKSLTGVITLFLLLMMGTGMFLLTPCSAIKAEASGGNSFDTAADFPSSSNYTDWISIGEGTSEYYKVTLPHDGYFKVNIMAKNCISMELNVYSSPDLSSRVLFAYDSFAEEESPKTATAANCLSAGTYYIRVTASNVYYNNKNNGRQCYKLQTQYVDYGVKENIVDSYDNPKGLSLGKTYTDVFTYTDRTDWYKIMIKNPGKYNLKVTSYNNDTEAHVKNSDLTKEQYLYCYTYSNGPRTAVQDVYLTKGIYYVHLSGTEGKYTFSLSPSKINNTKVANVKSVKSRKADVYFKNVDYIYGYQIRYSTDKKFKKGVKTRTFEPYKAKYAGNKRFMTIPKLSSGKQYYFQIRTYYTYDNVKYFSDWSKAKSIKVK